MSSLAVAADGWSLDATLLSSVAGGTYAGLNDFSTPGGKLVVTRKTPTPADPTATAIFDVPLTSVKRKPYPNGTDRQETVSGSDLDTEYSLAEFIYANEDVSAVFEAGFFTDDGSGGSSATNSGGTASVTNNSTLSYPLPQAAWLHHDLERATSGSFTAKLWVMHKFAMNGQPVHAVTILATDEHSNTASGTATTMTSEQFANGLCASYFAVTLDFSTLTQGDLVTLDAQIYPWIGDVFQISVDGFAYPSPNLSPVKILNDRTGGYGTVYAYVDGVGSGGSEAVSEVAATAVATPYATIAAAATAIQTYNAANFGRTDTGGGIIRIAASTTIAGLGANNMDTTLTDGKTPLVIEGASQSTSKWTPDGTNRDMPGILKFSNLTYVHVASTIALSGKNTAANMLVFEDVVFDANGNARYDAAHYKYGRGYLINCSGDEVGQVSSYSANQVCVLALGSSCVPLKSHSAIASKCVDQKINIYESSTIAARQGPILANCVISSNATGYQLVNLGSIDLGVYGAAIIGNVIETYGTSSQTSLKVSADSDTQACQNINVAMNAVVGNRTNYLYNDVGYALKMGMLKHNLMYELNQKSDYFSGAQDGTYIGNWSGRHFVGCFGNSLIRGDDNSQAVGSYQNWLGEALGNGKNELPRGFVIATTPDFTHDASYLTGDGTGGGDYALGASTNVGTVPAGETLFPTDLYGTAFPTDGTAYHGAVQ